MKTKLTIKSIEVLGKTYEVKLSREIDGYNYSVRGVIISTFGWVSGDMDDALAEAKSHIIYNSTPGKWINDN